MPPPPPPSIFSTYSQKGSFGRLILIAGSIEKKKENEMSTRCPIKKTEIQRNIE
jgi:hypothetical protein